MSSSSAQAKAPVKRKKKLFCLNKAGGCMNPRTEGSSASSTPDASSTNVIDMKVDFKVDQDFQRVDAKAVEALRRRPDGGSDDEAFASGERSRESDASYQGSELWKRSEDESGVDAETQRRRGARSTSELRDESVTDEELERMVKLRNAQGSEEPCDPDCCYPEGGRTIVGGGVSLVKREYDDDDYDGLCPPNCCCDDESTIHVEQRQMRVETPQMSTAATSHQSIKSLGTTYEETKMRRYVVDVEPNVSMLVRRLKLREDNGECEANEAKLEAERLGLGVWFGDFVDAGVENLRDMVGDLKKQNGGGDEFEREPKRDGKIEWDTRNQLELVVAGDNFEVVTKKKPPPKSSEEAEE